MMLSDNGKRILEIYIAEEDLCIAVIVERSVCENGDRGIKTLHVPYPHDLDFSDKPLVEAFAEHMLKNPFWIEPIDSEKVDEALNTK